MLLTCWHGVQLLGEVETMLEAEQTESTALWNAPSLHMHAGCAAQPSRHVEYFHDHARIEEMFFDGFRAPVKGVMYPDLTLPGLGLELKTANAEKYRDAL